MLTLMEGNYGFRIVARAVLNQHELFNAQYGLKAKVGRQPGRTSRGRGGFFRCGGRRSPPAVYALLAANASHRPGISTHRPAHTVRTTEIADHPCCTSQPIRVNLLAAGLNSARIFAPDPIVFFLQSS